MFGLSLTLLATTVSLRECQARPLTTTHLTARTTNTSGGNARNLQLSFVNNLASSNVNAYITGFDSNNQPVILPTNGSWHKPAGNANVPLEKTGPQVAFALNGGGNSTPQGQQTLSMMLPGYLTAGRIWFADGELDFFSSPSGGLVQ
jgi:hypothetical protein